MGIGFSLDICLSSARCRQRCILHTMSSSHAVVWNDDRPIDTPTILLSMRLHAHQSLLRSFASKKLANTSPSISQNMCELEMEHMPTSAHQTPFDKQRHSSLNNRSIKNRTKNFHVEKERPTFLNTRWCPDRVHHHHLLRRAAVNL